ncbi:hypothetical protein C8F04DRAFT_1198137 [Mycena alexandri]|uniref:Uncharacterized protein n=1 Tax=Mycena alexandri TaxID=1745969 RepID=A0AAD6S118_9AGAR|nr:hypothetical protein C8F04DRAFT_1198137 [Mycena alexandri]
MQIRPPDVMRVLVSCTYSCFRPHPPLPLPMLVLALLPNARHPSVPIAPMPMTTPIPTHLPRSCTPDWQLGLYTYGVHACRSLSTSRSTEDDNGADAGIRCRGRLSARKGRVSNPIPSAPSICGTVSTAHTPRPHVYASRGRMREVRAFASPGEGGQKVTKREGGKGDRDGRDGGQREQGGGGDGDREDERGTLWGLRDAGAKGRGGDHCWVRAG